MIERRVRSPSIPTLRGELTVPAELVEHVKHEQISSNRHVHRHARSFPQSLVGTCAQRIPVINVFTIFLNLKKVRLVQLPHRNLLTYRFTDALLRVLSAEC